MNEDFGYWEDEEDEVIGTYMPPEDDSEGYAENNVDGLNNEDLRLGFVRFVGTESGGINIYELIFTHVSMIDTFWGEHFNQQPASLCISLEPLQEYVSKVGKIRTVMKLNTIGECGCFSVQDAMDGCVCLAYQDLTHEEEYPECRLVLHFGETYEEVEHKLAQCRVHMS